MGPNNGIGIKKGSVIIPIPIGKAFHIVPSIENSPSVSISCAKQGVATIIAISDAKISFLMVFSSLLLKQLEGMSKGFMVGLLFNDRL